MTSLEHIAKTIVNESSSIDELRRILDEFASQCSEITGIAPDPSFDGWPDDTLLDYGVAINPKAAAYCVKDYLRSVMFIRGVHAAINTAQHRFCGQPINILYAGCGPFATLLLPLLSIIKPGDLHFHLVDIHQSSLDSVIMLLEHFKLGAHQVQTIKDDASFYQHPESLQLIIVETMQKSLEQEPQFSVTQNLAPQLGPNGIFIPENIEVELCLAHLQQEREIFKGNHELNQEALFHSRERYPIAKLLALKPEQASAEFKEARYNPLTAKHELAEQLIEIPDVDDLASYDPVIFTRIHVFRNYTLNDYDSEISLPYPCTDLLPLEGGACYEVCYELEGFPRFNFSRIS